MGQPIPRAQDPEDFFSDEEKQYWEDAAEKLRRTQLDQITSIAGKWSTLCTALLGIFGIIGFTDGLDTIAKYDEPYAVILRALVIVGALAAGTATVFSALAAGGLRWHHFVNLNWKSLSKFYREQPLKRRTYLKWSQIAGVIGVVAIAAAACVVFFVGTAAPAAPKVAAIVNGEIVCGKLTKTGTTVKVGDSQPSGPVSAIVPVTACP